LKLTDGDSQYLACNTLTTQYPTKVFLPE
jgi:hypothetical protein